MDEHGCEFVNGLMLILPYIFQFLLHTGRTRAQEVELLFDVILLRGQIRQ